MAGIKINKNNTVKSKHKVTKKSTWQDDAAIIFLANFWLDFTTQFPLITTALLTTTNKHFSVNLEISAEICKKENNWFCHNIF